VSCLKRGLIQVYTGDGKGKTTAAIGQAVRAYGRGWRVIVFQFLKKEGGSGEQPALAGLRPPLPVRPLGTGEFIINRPPTLEEIRRAEEGWDQVVEAMNSREYDLVVVDELSHAMNTGLLKVDRVVADLGRKPEELSLVLTGRNMPEPVLTGADLITEMCLVKHPFQKGIAAREGIEY
jgi:cob(I)alamin adenosyltransferase